MSGELITPASTVSTVRLPATGTLANVSSSLPIGAYTASPQFQSGAVAQVGYVYSALAGRVVDVEITEQDVYAQFEAAALEFSTLINIHQTENTLGSLLGSTTASFSYQGESISGSTAESTYPRYDFGYARRVAESLSQEAHVGGTVPVYSASIDIVRDLQDYDLQSIVQNNSNFSASVGTKRIIVRKVYYRAASATWRFYGYYGGLNVVGNLSTYGQYADDSVYEVIPAWHNKLQAMAFEDSIWTRTSHYSYEIHNNKLRLFPVPSGLTPEKIWFEFSIPQDPWEEATGTETGISGVNNLANVPFANIPYENISSMGKHWIRQFCLALCKEVLAKSRGKWSSMAFPGDNLTLDAAELRAEAAAEKEYLRSFLVDKLDKMLYDKIIEKDAKMAKDTEDLYDKAPLLVYVK